LSGTFCPVAFCPDADYSPDEHFVDEDAERPPVDGFAVASALDDFRRQVLGCAA